MPKRHSGGSSGRKNHITIYIWSSPHITLYKHHSLQQSSCITHKMTGKRGGEGGRKALWTVGSLLPAFDKCVKLWGVCFHFLHTVYPAWSQLVDRVALLCCTVIKNWLGCYAGMILNTADVEQQLPVAVVAVEACPDQPYSVLVSESSTKVQKPVARRAAN